MRIRQTRECMHKLFKYLHIQRQAQRSLYTCTLGCHKCECQRDPSWKVKQDINETLLSFRYAYTYTYHEM